MVQSLFNMQERMLTCRRTHREALVCFLAVTEVIGGLGDRQIGDVSVPRGNNRRNAPAWWKQVSDSGK